MSIKEKQKKDLKDFRSNWFPPNQMGLKVEHIEVKDPEYVMGCDPYKANDEVGQVKQPTVQVRAKRFNKGKPRHELVPSFAMEKLVEVYTRGAHKYSVYKTEHDKLIKGADIPFEDLGSFDNLQLVEDGANNWRLGQDWLSSMGSVKRHIADWEKGIDMDPDPAMKTFHLANAAWGLFSLLEFYKIYPEGDNRPHKYLNQPKIGLDIDEVLCNWVGDWTEKYNMETPTSWSFDKDIVGRFNEMKDKNELDDFFLNLSPLIKPEDIPFEPHCYITSRPVKSEVSKQWLQEKGFPARPVFTTGVGMSKVDIAKEQGIDIFVDDGYHNFVDLNKAGICCYLMDAPHNRRYNVGHKRIFNLKELM